MAEAWKFRNNSLDQAIFNDVVVFNEYQLPLSFAPEEIVIDVGAHTGAFGYAALTRGCEHVYCIEPDPMNCELAAENLSEYLALGYVEMTRGAAWRSDPNDDELRFDGYHPFPKSYADMQGIINTGNGSVIWGVGERVEKVAFDEIVDRVTHHGEQRVRLLKLDCEGAEWPILLTSRRLHLIDEICGEFHEIGGQFLEISEDRPSSQPVFHHPQITNFVIEELSTFLTAAGFTVTHRRHRRTTGTLEGLGLFFARREQKHAIPA